MRRTPVTSSNIRSIGYDPQSGTLEVEFNSGDIYQYFDVPESIYQGLVRAASPGRFLNINIVRYGYRYKKV